jgi:hypothetical protein
MKCASQYFPRVYCVGYVIAITLLGAGACASAQSAYTTTAFFVANAEDEHNHASARIFS